MIKVRQVAMFCLLSFMFSLLFPGRSYAYIDPGTGSYLWQLVIAGLLAASFSLKIFWRRIKAFLENYFNKRRKNGQ